MTPPNTYIALLLASFVALPHLFEIHPGTSLLFISAIIYRCAHEKFKMPLPSKFLGSFLAVTAMALTVFFEGIPLGVAPASALLLITIATMMLRQSLPKDMILMFFSFGVLLICSALYDQTLFSTIHVLLSFAIMLLFMARSDTQQMQRVLSHKRLLFKNFLLLLPVVLLLFFITPRASRAFIPPLLNQQASTGFSNSLDPGAIGSLISSNEPAFKARFEEITALVTKDLYWRGSTLTQNNGMSWSAGKSWLKNSTETPKETNHLKTQMILEPKFNKWLFSLDTSDRITIDDYRWRRKVIAHNDKTFSLKDKLSERLLYYTFSQEKNRGSLNEQELQQYLQIPRPINRELKDFVEKINMAVLNESNPNHSFAMTLGRYFIENDFKYSLRPGVMEEKTVENFMFKTKIGFCEHYAAASAHLLRLAGIPARIVLGFHGGELNNFDDFLTIRGKDAHAWVEYFDNNLGEWVRFDATAFVAPDRLQNGGQSYHLLESDFVSQGLSILPQSLSEAFVNIRKMFSALENHYNLFMLTFNFNVQKEFLAKLNLPQTKMLLFVFFVAILGVFGVASFLMMAKRRKAVDPDLMLYHKLCTFLQNSGTTSYENMTPGDLKRFIVEKSSPQSQNALQFIDLFIEYRYAPQSKVSFSDLQKAFKEATKKAS